MDAAIHAALMAQIEAMALSVSIVVAYPGKGSEPEPEYLRATHLPNIPDRLGLSDRAMLSRQGILALDLFSPFGQHEAVYKARGDAILAEFPLTLRLTAGSATVHIAKTYQLPGRADGARWFTPLRIEYRVSGATA